MPVYKPFLAFLLTVSLVAPQAVAQRRRAVAHPERASLQPVDHAAAAAIARGVPGLVISVRKGSAIQSTSAYGESSAETIFQIGSLTKQFTAALILRFAEQHALSLSDRLSRFVPDLGPHAQRITIEQLLRHTSGLKELRPLVMNGAQTQEACIRALGAAPLDAEPGTEWQYRNSNYYLLGIVLERLDGRGYATILANELFAPLGMDRTSYCGVPPAVPMPQGHVLDGGAVRKIGPNDVGLSFAAGGICSTASDLLRWNDALVRGEVIAPESYAAMTTSMPLPDGANPEYGFGLFVVQQYGRTAILHGGKVPGFSSHLAHHPADDLTIAVLTTLSTNARDDAQLIAEDIAEALLAW